MEKGQSTIYSRQALKEQGIEDIEQDELVEATPSHRRLRKRILDPNERKRMAQAAKG